MSGTAARCITRGARIAEYMLPLQTLANNNNKIYRPRYSTSLKSTLTVTILTILYPEQVKNGHFCFLEMSCLNLGRVALKTVGWGHFLSHPTHRVVKHETTREERLNTKIGLDKELIQSYIETRIVWPLYPVIFVLRYTMLNIKTI